VKRGRERDYDPNQNDRDEVQQGPLWVEPIVAPHSNRQRYGLPVMIVIFVALIMTVAMTSRFVTYFSAAGPSADPTLVTPIAWIDTTVAPSPTASLAAAQSAAPSHSVSASPSASAVRSAGPSAQAAGSSITPAVATPSLQVTSIWAVIDSITNAWYLGAENHFTLNLANTSPLAVSMSPCPVYRIYILGTDPNAAPLRLLNCAAIGDAIKPGQTVSLDMVYTPTLNDPLGPQQQLVWEWVSPNTIQAVTAATIDIAQ
jgi:hypothetical protein